MVRASDTLEANMSDEDMSARRISGSLGAEVRGFDLSLPLSAKQFDVLNDLLLEHRVIFLRGQGEMKDDDQLSLAGRFGEISVYPLLKLLDMDLKLEVIEDSPESPPGADEWHTDVTWIECPPKVAILSALEIPEYGGDTLWADMHGAYEALSETMREMIDPLQVNHGLQENFFSRVEAKAGADLARRVREELSDRVQHPLVRTHPETGKKSLFISGSFMIDVVGMHPEESRALLDFLTAHALQPRFQCRWRWQEGDVAIWDERCTLHHALPDHFPQRRKMRRCTIDGQRPC
jgi:taurine dioxygenase